MQCILSTSTETNTMHQYTHYCCRVVVMSQDMGMEVCYSESGRKLPDHIPDECHMVFVCDSFSGADYDRLVEKKFRCP